MEQKSQYVFFIDGLEIYSQKSNVTKHKKINFIETCKRVVII